MTTICSKCHSECEVTAKFCHKCGKPIATTGLDEQTVVMNPSRKSLSDVERRSIIERTQRAFGSENQATVTGLPTPVDRSQRELLFLIEDVFGSMGGRYDAESTKLQAAVQASIVMIANKEKLDPHDEIGIVTFNHQAELLVPLAPITVGKHQMVTRLQALTHGGGTQQELGLIEANNACAWDRENVVRRIVMQTDGHGGDPREIAQYLKSRGVVIDVIGVGDHPSDVNEDLLRQTASTIEGQLRYRFIKDHNTLDAHYTQLANKTATAVR